MSFRGSSHAKHEGGRGKQKTGPWFSGLMKRPQERHKDEMHFAFSTLKEFKELEKFHPELLHQICLCAHYCVLNQNVLVLRHGEYGGNWYIVLSGSLSVCLPDHKRAKLGNPLCLLGPGACFGESIITTDPHLMSIVTTSKVELLRVKLKDFKFLWEKHKEMMETAVTSLSSLPNLCEDMKKLLPVKEQSPHETVSNLAQPITFAPSDEMTHCAWVLRTVLLSTYPHMIRDRKYHLRLYRRCFVGAEMVNWFMSNYPRLDCRDIAVGMCQAMLEEGVISHVCLEHPFKDGYLFYRFALDEKNGGGKFPSEIEIEKASEDLQDVFATLANASSDANMRMILRKLPEDRRQDDIEVVYEELLQLKPLSHLSYTVKRELASVIVFEAHTKSGNVLFNQGDEGQSWYIILKGSVNVSIYGKGVVCVLNEGEDFGKLALMNDAPRAATIVLREDNCHFLRVDKDHFNRILRDVEANTVRLKEHGQDVLVLEKIPTVDGDVSFQSNYKYSVMAGTPEKMLEYLLETKMDPKKEQQTNDLFLDDFITTRSIFFPDDKMCSAILSHYHSKSSQDEDQDDNEFVLSQKKSVVQFLLAWYKIQPDPFLTDQAIGHFLETVTKYVQQDCQAHPGLQPDYESLQTVLQSRKSTSKPVKKKSLFPSRRGSGRSVSGADREGDKKGIRCSDDHIFKVYCADHTYTSIRLPLNSTVHNIVAQARDKLCLGPDPILCEVKSSGERVIFIERDRCITTMLSLNGRLFIAPREHLDALTPLPEQEGPTSSTVASLELMSTKELANEITLYDWELFTAINEQELFWKLFKQSLFPDCVTANLDRFLSRFNEIQYWVVTEMVLVPSVNKRVQLLRKFTKLAQHCKELHNIHAFFAIISGLSNIAVSRLSQTWEKLPSKAKKIFSEFENMMDPARNHRACRLLISKLTSPIVPLMPLVVKDLTFTNEGNKTYYDAMVNFEKMHMIAQTLRTVRYCRQNQMELDDVTSGVQSLVDIKNYVRNFSVIDNQRILTNLSHKCEPRKT